MGMLLLDIALEALFITNLWVLLYTKLLFILNTLFPPSAASSFLWVPSLPEPFEIPLYLLLTLALVCFLWITKALKNKISSVSLIIKILLVVFLFWIFMKSLGGYPQVGQLDPYPPRTDKTIYLTVSLVYLSVVLFLMLLISFVSRFLKNRKFFTFLLYGFVGIIIALSTFDGRFPMAGHDYEYFIGPSWEILNGKTIYTDVLSRYAFLTVEFFALLQKFHILSLFYIPFIIWILYIIQYLLTFFLLKKVSRSSTFSFLGLASIMTVNYFSLSHLPSVIPQVGPLRWLPMIIAVIFLYRFKKIDSVSFIILVAALSFSMIDVGIAFILAYGTTICILFLQHEVSLSKVVKSLFKLFFCLLTIFIFVNLIHFLLGYKLVDLLSPLYSFRKHAVLGLSMMPIAEHTYFWIVLLIYFATIIYIFRNKLSNSNSKHLTSNVLLLFSANLSLFASVYYVGRSHPHNLFNIALFPLLNFFLLLGSAYGKIHSTKIKLFVIFLLFLVFIVYPTYQRRFTLTEMIFTKLTRLNRANPFQSEVDETITSMYKNEINLIKDTIDSDETTILSVDDSYLFLKTGKKNLLDANPIMGIDLPSDLDFAVKTAIKKCPQHIVVDCSTIGKCSPYTPFIGATFNLKLILDKIESGCRTKYEAKSCTIRLCIAEAKRF